MRKCLEKVIGKLRAGSMPPPGMPRPDPATYRADRDHARKRNRPGAGRPHPNPGRIGAVHRLNRAEYNNAIRDLFALDLDVKPLLPGDDTADGSFDNFADVLSISTAHLERYMSVARQVTRLATGLPPAQPNLETFEIPLHVLQERPAERRSAVRIARRHRGSLRLSRSTASTSLRFASSGSIRITSRAWAGRSSSTSAWMASC